MGSVTAIIRVRKQSTIFSIYVTASSYSGNPNVTPVDLERITSLSPSVSDDTEEYMTSAVDITI